MNVNTFSEAMKFDLNNCFVCGISLTSENKTAEHVFPKWLLNRYNLWEEKLTLLNSTLIPYKNLTIPCCSKCNNTLSANIELPVKTATEKGIDYFKGIDKKLLFQWINKIQYGVLFKESLLRSDVKLPNSGNIYPDEILSDHQMQHVFLRSATQGTEFVRVPYSILLFKVRNYQNFPYWHYDNPLTGVFCIRMGNIGIIAHLQDGGVSEQIFTEVNQYNELLEHELDIIQFTEVCARFCYKSSLMDLTPNFMTLVKDKDSITDIITIPKNKVMGDNWNFKNYAYFLSSLLSPWGVTFENIYVENQDQVRTFLWKEDDSFNSDGALREIV